jgi:RimJ/RimL family protein N-acetyltransferase
VQIRQLSSADVVAFLALRARALFEEPERFRVTTLDDQNMGVAFWQNRLNTDRVYGVVEQEQLIGVGGLSRFVGEKLSHKGLIWGMFIAKEARGTQASHLLMTALIDGAKGYVTHVQLTLMADNARARSYYERHGFVLYGVEPQSVLTPNGLADEALMYRLVDGVDAESAVSMSSVLHKKP